MYHYVRSPDYSNFRNLNYLDVQRFEQQLKDLMKSGATFSLPERANFESYEPSTRRVSLTFDDGYKEHLVLVAPILEKYGIKATFFVPTQPLVQIKVLLVNQIHIVLSEYRDREVLYEKLIAFLSQENSFSSSRLLSLKKNYFVAGKFDDKFTNFVKRTLQRGVDKKIAEAFLDQCADYKNINWEEVHKITYLTSTDVIQLQKSGHRIGLHSHRHHYYADLNYEEQYEDFDTSISILNRIGVYMNELSIAYPYGSFDQNTISLLGEFELQNGFIDNMNIVSKEPLELVRPRLDCNHIEEILLQEK